MAAATPAAPAHALLIDNFSTGPGLLEVPNMTPAADGWLQSDTLASVPGGSRSLALRNTPGSTAVAFIQARAADGLQAYRLPTQTLLVSLGYGQLAPMNLDLGGQSALALEMAWGGVQLPGGVWDAGGLTVTAYANTSTGAGQNPDGSAASVVLRGTGVVDLPFAAFTTNSSTGRPVNWSDVDSLLFVVTENVVGGGAAGFGLRSVSAVPEPGTWALAAAGVLALLAWRRRLAA